MTLNISPEKMAEYRQGARRRAAARQAKLDERFYLAWEIARQGAEILRTRFHAEKVIVFGSLLDRSRFHERSDIDLAAWGIAEKDYLRALGSLLDLTTEFSVDLVRVEEAREHLRKEIETQGMLL
ncbi:MAG: nucleotidyltransferase domain-containing protein [Chloroflexi bacterium]|nr:nucleotidyltransferase domain-containing protein [Chloroflexota bacterium]